MFPNFGQQQPSSNNGQSQTPPQGGQFIMSLLMGSGNAPPQQQQVPPPPPPPPLQQQQFGGMMMQQQDPHSGYIMNQQAAAMHHHHHQQQQQHQHQHFAQQQQQQQQQQQPSLLQLLQGGGGGGGGIPPPQQQAGYPSHLQQQQQPLQQHPVHSGLLQQHSQYHPQQNMLKEGLKSLLQMSGSSPPQQQSSIVMSSSSSTHNHPMNMLNSYNNNSDPMTANRAPSLPAAVPFTPPQPPPTSTLKASTASAAATTSNGISSTTSSGSLGSSSQQQHQHRVPAASPSSSGYKLPPKRSYCDFDDIINKNTSTGTTSSQTQQRLTSLESQTITLVPSKLEHRYAKTVAVDVNFICYAVRGGKIRVIDQQSGCKTLLRGHDSAIFELDIVAIHDYNNNKCCSRLLSSTVNHVFILWELSVAGDDIISKPLLTIEGNPDASVAGVPRFPFVAWNPVETDIFVMVGSPRDVFLIDTRILVKQIEDPAEGIVLKEAETELEHIDGILRTELSEQVKDIAYSPDGSAFAIATERAIKFYASSSTTSLHLIHKYSLPNSSNYQHHSQQHHLEIESLILCCGDSPSTAPKYIGPTIAIVGLNENRLIRVMGLSNWSVLYEFGYQLTMAPSSKPASGGGGGIHFESLVWDKRLNALLISSTARPFLASLALKTHAATVTGGSAGDDSIGMRMVDFLKGTRTLNVDYTGVGFEYLNFYDMKDAMLSFRTSPVIGSSTTPSSSSSIYAVQSKSVDMFSISASHALPSNFYSRPMLPIDESVMHLFATSSAAVGNGTAAAAVANGGASSSVSSSTVPAVTAPTSNISTAAASSSSATTATSSVAPASSHHGMPEEASNNSASANHHVSFSANTSTTFQEEKDPVIKHDPNAHVHFGPESLVLSSSGTKNHEKKASSSANGALGSKDTSRSGEIGDDDYDGEEHKRLPKDVPLNIKEKVHIEEKMKKSSNSDLHLHTILKKSPSTSMPNVLGSSLLNLSALHSSTDSLTTASEAFNSPRSKRVSFSNLELAAIVNDEANGGASVVNSGVAVVHHSIADASILSSDDSEGKSPIAAVADRPVSVSPKRSHSPSRRTSPPPMLTEDDRAKKASCEKLETVTFAPVHIPGSMSPINSSGLSESQYRSLMKEIKNMEIDHDTNLRSMLNSLLPSLVKDAVKRDDADLASNISASVEKQLTKSLPLQLEKILSDSVPKVLSKPKVIESVSTSVSSSVKPVVEQMFKDTFRNVFMPGMQKAVTAMFAQIHETLEQGLNEAFKQHQGVDNTKNVVMKRLESSLETLSAKMESNQDTDIIQGLFEKYSSEMNETIARTIGIEVRKTLQQEYGVLGSIAEKGKRGSINSPSTPIIPEVDIKAEITKDLEYNDFESAFTKVLASSDLSSVLYLCSKVSPKQVFTGSAVLLSQPVILSLVHQISLDMRKSSLLKMNWIQECVMNLNVDDELISQHAVRVLSLVGKRIEDFVQALSDTTANNNNGGADGGSSGVDAKTAASILRTAKVLMMIIKGAGSFSQ